MNYHNITKGDIVNGDGIRVVLWVSGCSHHCKECHNPETWDQNSGILFDESAKEEIFHELRRKEISGITFSGGDPLFINNRPIIESLMQEIKTKFPKKTIWLYTGYKFEEISNLELLKYVDVIVDGEFEIKNKKPKLKWKGSSNQRVIDVQKTIQSKDRTPVIYCE